MTPQQADGSWQAPRSGTCPASHVLILQTFNDRTGRSGISFTGNKRVFVLDADTPRLVRGWQRRPWEVDLCRLCRREVTCLRRRLALRPLFPAWDMGLPGFGPLVGQCTNQWVVVRACG